MGFSHFTARTSSRWHYAAAIEQQAFDAADFECLPVSTDVTFAEEAGEKGPRASTVRVLGKHHYVTQR